MSARRAPYSLALRPALRDIQKVPTAEHET
jgi:hypothetical protein